MSISTIVLRYISAGKVAVQISKLDNKNRDVRALDYANHQYGICLRRGLDYKIAGKTILEIGCGHGGISCFLAVNGADMVYGLDINEYDLKIADQFKESLEQKLQAQLPVSFINQNVHHLDFPDGHFDLIVADNVFEHFDDNVAVMEECLRVLKPGGRVVVPNFPSIYSKNGAHLKKGVAVPWVYVFFKEKTIIEVLKQNAVKYPVLYEVYGGLKNDPDNIRDVRRYKDLNYISNKKFRSQVHESGFQLERFGITYANRWLGIIAKFIPGKFSILHDILSMSSSAVLRKPKA